MKITDATTHARSIRTVIDYEELKQLAIKAVAAEAGVRPGSDGFTARAFHSTRDTSTGVQHDMTVEITIDLTSSPRAAE